ncbi:translation initiation factor IF-2 [Candidatus Beckwithbacteria bacterium]|nr:translation initiation factor IF-2 [Candidatus Beckwithbacteria bacterium]
MAKKKTTPAQSQKKHPPVVVVLGHVDHGKTTLLDAIRESNVTASEAGGITQHIGAYQTQLRANDPSSIITFIDTPGHEAFSKMRSRGAQVADIAILVVAANDGVKPQTKEAIAHIKKAQIPFVVAINKVDLPEASLEMVKAQLAEQEIFVEGYGGDIVAVPISAKAKQGIDQLLEMIELIWELQEISPDTQDLKAVVLDSFLDSKKGVVANLLIRSGEIVVGQTVFCKNQETKVRCLITPNNEQVKKATISQPIQLLGFKHVLDTGELVTAKSQEHETAQSETGTTELVPEESKNEEQKRLKIIIKADQAGTLEAITANLTEEIELVGHGVGDINESDVLLAQSTEARLIGFHVKVPTLVKKLAEMEKVKIETFDIIYHLLEDLQARVLKLLEPTINEEVLGKAEVIAEFKIKGSHIAGCKVLEGKIVRSEKVRIIRGEQIVAEPRIGALQVERKDETEAKKGQEVALVFRPDLSFKIGDQVVSYKIIDD